MKMRFIGLVWMRVGHLERTTNRDVSERTTKHLQGPGANRSLEAQQKRVHDVAHRMLHAVEASHFLDGRFDRIRYPVKRLIRRINQFPLEKNTLAEM